MEKITQQFDRCAIVANRALCIAALIFSPLSAHAETAALQYDNNGNITQRSVTNGATTQTTTYTYDALNRLTGESGPAKTQTITYDENGNRLSDGVGSYTYEPVSNRMSTRLGLAVTFDATGNMTADGTGRTFTYNEFNQMDQVFQGGVLLATYEYDANGLRLSKTTTASAPQGAQTVVYIHDQWGKIMEEFTGTNTLIRSYIWRGDTPVAQIEHTSGGDKILHFDPDHLNTPRAAMDETGKVVWRWEPDAFGSTLPNEDADGDGNLTTINLRIGGYQYADVENGLFYNGHRYYSPLLGIFTQTDRLDLLRQAVNPLYAGYSEPTDLQKALNQPFNYASNNPMSYVDPLGLTPSGSVFIGPPLFPIFEYNHPSSCGSGDEFPNQFNKKSVESACQAHDSCYSTCGSNKNQCDQNFLKQMQESCGKDVSCRNAAYAYYRAVSSSFGVKAFSNAQRGCQCKAK